MTIFGPGDCWRGDPEGVAAQSERLLQCDSKVQRLAVILDLWGNCRGVEERSEALCFKYVSVQFKVFVKSKKNRCN